jgi:hypothetical protein
MSPSYGSIDAEAPADPKALRAYRHVTDAKETMEDSLRRGIRNHSHAGALLKKADALRNDACLFRNNSRRYRCKMRWRALRARVLLCTVVLLVLLVILEVYLSFFTDDDEERPWWDGESTADEPVFFSHLLLLRAITYH